MKIPAAKADSFIKAPDKNLIAALIYGPDVGLVSQRAELISKNVVEDLANPFNVVDLDSDSLKEDPTIVNDEMSAISFMGGKRLIRLRNVGNEVLPHIKDCLSDIDPSISEHCFLLITAGNLKAGGIRKFFEDGKNIAAIPCYVDDNRSLYGYASELLRSKNVSFSNDVITYIAEHCRGDRMIVVSEIEKLLLYIGDKKKIELEDVKLCIGKTTEATIEDICQAVASGNQKKLSNNIQKAFNQGIMPIVIIRSLYRYLTRIHITVANMEKGVSVDSAIKKLYPPVFFKQMPAMKQEVNRWSQKNSNSLWSVIENLYQAEIDCKGTSQNQELFCNRCLMKIAFIASSK